MPLEEDQTALEVSAIVSRMSGSGFSPRVGSKMYGVDPNIVSELAKYKC